MSLNLLILDGYGMFVWPAFIFTFVSLFIVYIKTKKELIKQEKIFFSEFKEKNFYKIPKSKQERLAGGSLSATTTF